jgi:hypothetical protein
MASYIFLTSEGSTFQPDSESENPDIENLQVIGFSDGPSPDEAFRRLLEECSYLLETTFEVIFCYELAEDYEMRRRDYRLPVNARRPKSGA